jgi:hypothetical protein
MGIGTTFHDNVIDADLLDDAMTLAISDPVGLLSKPGRPL